MKKTVLILLGAVLVLSLAACGANEELHTEPLAPVETENTAPASEAEDIAAEEDVSASDLPGEAEEPASETDAAAVDPAIMQAAQACIGQPVEALFEAVGEPVDTQYAASCLEENAEDGMLFYDGFYVWTVRTDAEEIVHEIYVND